jgi:alpha-L-rhamnosidase
MSDDCDEQVVPCDLRTEDDSGLVACGLPEPRLSWRLAAQRSGVRQLGYEIEVAANSAFTENIVRSGVVEQQAPFLARWPAPPLESREKRWWRVRVRTDRGWTRWSKPAEVEATLLQRADWIARPISPESNKARTNGGPTPLLRREFTLAHECRLARLYVTALGLHDVQINATPVSADLLEPGWTDYPGRHLFAIYDVTALLRVGRNAVSSAVGEGWWRGELTWMKRRACYGDTTALLAQLEIETVAGERILIVTDEHWRGAYGGLQLAELYHGVDFDQRLEPNAWRSPDFDDSNWERVVTVELPPILEPRTMPGVRVIRVCSPSNFARVADGRISVDVGQNIAGYLRLGVLGPRGARLSVRHAEVLDESGRLHTAPLRNARATDNYILGGGDKAVLEPRFTFHGFRYAEIEASAGVEVESVEVIVIGSALAYSGAFECSEPALNRLFQNTVWSQRGNFVALPTDCPQRDERLGWTVDIQVFAEAACLHADCRTFLASWLKDLALEQRDDGCVPSTVPNVIRGHEFEYGGVGWGDAATLVPWAVYLASGDIDVLARHYDSMRRWVDYGASRRNQDGLWVGDLQLGDWLDPGAPPDRPHLATTDSSFIATAYLAYSARILARSAEPLGRRDQGQHYHALSRDVAAAAWRRWEVAAATTQTGCAMAIMFDIAPESQHAAIGAALADLVERNRGRIATGFLGTPLVLPALTRTGQLHAAYRLLLNRECPGWLYQVERGATTMWERWDAVLADGSLHKGEMGVGGGASMISFNHYAYGSVATWLYHTVAGIAPHPSGSGFSHVLFAPRPGGGLTYASASVSTPYGHTSIDWTLSGRELRVSIELPPGATGEFSAPPEFRSAAGERSVALASGTHRIACCAR